MTNEIKEIIQCYEITGDFTYTILDNTKKLVAEKELGVSLPKQYLEFLTTYGHGGIEGLEIIGVGKNGNLLFVEETLNLRRYNLPKEYIVIEDCDEWIYCIDSISEKVFSWSPNQLELAYNSFDDFLLDRLNDAKENI